MARNLESDEVLVELREQTRWLRFLGLQALAPALESTLKSDSERSAYDVSDGTRSTRAVADMVGVSQKTISNWWQKWASAGIATTDPTGRAAHMASLRSAGIEIPAKTSKEASTNDG
jgi:DNA-binding transcriptional MocR family regulator